MNDVRSLEAQLNELKQIAERTVKDLNLDLALQTLAQMGVQNSDGDWLHKVADLKIEVLSTSIVAKTRAHLAGDLVYEAICSKSSSNLGDWLDLIAFKQGDWVDNALALAEQARQIQEQDRIEESRRIQQLTEEIEKFTPYSTHD